MSNQMLILYQMINEYQGLGPPFLNYFIAALQKYLDLIFFKQE